MCDNQWIQLSGNGGGINFAHVRELEPLDDGQVVVHWSDGGATVFGEDAARILVWLRERPIPVLRET